MSYLWNFYMSVLNYLKNNVFSLNMLKTITKDQEGDDTVMNDMSKDSTPEKADEKMDLPEIYIDSEFLPKQNGESNNSIDKEIFDKVYEINGDTFYEEPFKEENVYREFKIRTVEEDVTVNTTDYQDESSNLDLEYTIQDTPYGIIVNSIIFVTENQWHTIMSMDCGVKCIVCGVTVETPKDHIKLAVHMNNLDKHQPLKKFDFNITRKIGDNYHCGICNVIVDVNNIDTHIDSKEHEEKMLFAINRSSDILFDLNDDHSNKLNDYHYDGKRCSVSDASYDDESVDGFYEYDVASNDTDSLNGNFKDKIDISPKKMSYASVADKPPVKLVDQVKLDYTDRNVRIKFDSWNMIVTPKRNEMYCMVCVRYEPIANKAKHCLDKGHLDKLSRCAIVEKYKQHFIRKVDDKYYHCGHCNSLQYIPDIENHIELIHKTKKPKINQDDITTEINENNEQESIDNNDSTSKNNEEELTNRESNENVIHESNESSDNQMQTIQSTSAILSGYFIVIYQFNHFMRVSFISYNIVCQRERDYYCGICEYAATEMDMRRHINGVDHIKKLTLIPFDVYFGINLIRRLRSVAHCTICNVVFDLALTYAHVFDQMHRFFLTQAVMTTPNQNAQNLEPTTMNQCANESSTSMNQTETDVNDSKVESNENQLDIAGYNGEYIYLKNKNSYVKVSFKSYNSLLSIGDGTCYCFVCSERVFGPIKGHIENETHLNCLNKYDFIDKYEKHLLRQIDFKYHCCICNLIFMKSELATHLAWVALNAIKTDKKIRKIDFKSGIKHINIKTTQESFVADEPELKVEILIRIDYKNAPTDVVVKKTSKVIIFNGNTVKVSWDAWHGLCKGKNGYRCQLCRLNVKGYEVNGHIGKDQHENMLVNTFERKFLPSLLRKVNDTTMNCVTCNMEVLNREHLINEHINGKRHKKHFNVNKETDLKTTSANDVLYL